MSDIEVTTTGDITVCSFNTGVPGNRLTADHVRNLTRTFLDLDAARSAALLLRGGADFCAGRAEYPQIADRADVEALVGESVNLLGAFSSLGMPTVTFVSGAAAGLGASLAVRSDIVVAAPDATFSFPEMDAGFVPMLAMHSLAMRVRRSAALWLVTTGVPVAAERAVQLGLASEVGDVSVAMTRARTFAERSAAVVRARDFADQLYGAAPLDLHRVATAMVDEYWRGPRAGRGHEEREENSP